MFEKQAILPTKNVYTLQIVNKNLNRQTFSTDRVDGGTFVKANHTPATDKLHNVDVRCMCKRFIHSVQNVDLCVKTKEAN